MIAPACRLLVEDDGLSAWRLDRRILRCLGRFTASADGLARFGEFLAVDRKRRHVLLTNLAEEACFPDTLPTLSHRERQAVLARRRARLFPDSSWHTSLLTGRRQVTHLGLPHASRLTPWLERLQASGAQLLAVNTLSQLISAWLNHTTQCHGPALVLSRHTRQFRLTAVAQGGRLIASQAVADAPELDAALDRFRQRPEVSSVLAAGTPLQLIGDAGLDQRFPGQHFTPAPDGDASQLLLTLADRHWPRAQLAANDWLAPARQARLANYLYAGGAIALSLGLTGWASLHGPNAALDVQLETIEQHLADTRAQRRAIDTARRQLPLPADRLHKLADTHPALDAAARQFPAALALLSQALDAHPALQLDEITWQNPVQPPSTASAARLTLRLSLPDGTADDVPLAIAALLTTLSSSFEAAPIQHVSAAPHAIRLILHPRQP